MGASIFDQFRQAVFSEECDRRAGILLDAYDKIFQYDAAPDAANDPDAFIMRIAVMMKVASVIAMMVSQDRTIADAVRVFDSLVRVNMQYEQAKQERAAREKANNEG